MNPHLNVLLVEDNEDDQYFFSEALRGIDNNALFAAGNNGKQALDILRKAAALPDIIFTDINMPVMDGVEFLMEVMKDPRTKNIPVVILSSDTSVAGVTCSLGAKAFIKKPITIELLRKHLDKILAMDLTGYNHTAYQTFAAVSSEPLGNNSASRKTFYKSSSGISRLCFIFLKKVGVSPVIFLNCLERCPTLL